jgi:hypothetical protein
MSGASNAAGPTGAPEPADLHVLLCDDHRLFAEAWALVLDARGAHVVEVCSSVAECLDALGR